MTCARIGCLVEARPLTRSFVSRAILFSLLLRRSFIASSGAGRAAPPDGGRGVFGYERIGTSFLARPYRLPLKEVESENSKWLRRETLLTLGYSSGLILQDLGSARQVQIERVVGHVRIQLHVLERERRHVAVAFGRAEPHRNRVLLADPDVNARELFIGFRDRAQHTGHDAVDHFISDDA